MWVFYCYKYYQIKRKIMTISKKRIRGNPLPLIIEPHPADYVGYPFITLIEYRDTHLLGIIDNATDKALKTWDREPLFHISSPLEGWNSPKPFRHHDFIDPKDFPEYWKKLDNLTVEIEAKAKEVAIEKLYQDLGKEIPIS